MRAGMYGYFHRFSFFSCPRKLASAVIVPLLLPVFLFSLYSKACFCCFCTATFASFSFFAVLGGMLLLFLYSYFRRFSFFSCTWKLASALFVPLLSQVFLFSLYSEACFGSFCTATFADFSFFGVLPARVPLKRCYHNIVIIRCLFPG